MKINIIFLKLLEGIIQLLDLQLLRNNPWTGRYNDNKITSFTPTEHLKSVM